MLAPGQSKSPRKGRREGKPSGRKAKGRRGGTAVGTDLARAGSPSPVWAQPRGAPDTPTAPRRPRHRVLRSRAGPRGGQRPRPGRGAGGAGRAARAALLTWRSASRIGRRPPRLAPACFPAPGSPEHAAWTAAAAAPRPPCTGSRCAPVRRRAERAARGSGARGKLWLGVCDRRTGIRAPSVPPPSPTRGLPLSSGAAPVAPWRPPREGPTPNPPPATPEGPLANRSGTKPWVPGQQTSSGKEEDSLDRRVARVEGSVVRIGQDPLGERKKG